MIEPQFEPYGVHFRNCWTCRLMGRGEKRGEKRGVEGEKRGGRSRREGERDDYKSKIHGCCATMNSV